MIADIDATDSIASSAVSTASLGIKRLKIRIIPMFLGMGKHAREDLPELAAALLATHPDIDFDITQTVGEDSRVTALLARIAVETAA